MILERWATDFALSQKTWKCSDAKGRSILAIKSASVATKTKVSMLCARCAVSGCPTALRYAKSAGSTKTNNSSPNLNQQHSNLSPALWARKLLKTTRIKTKTKPQTKA